MHSPTGLHPVLCRRAPFLPRLCRQSPALFIQLGRLNTEVEPVALWWRHGWSQFSRIKPVVTLILRKSCLWGCLGVYLWPKAVRWWGRFLEQLHLQAQSSWWDHFLLSFFSVYLNLFSKLFLFSLGDDPFLASSSHCYSHSGQGWADQVFYPKQGTSGLLPVTWLAFCSVECSLLESLFL